VTTNRPFSPRATEFIETEYRPAGLGMSQRRPIVSTANILQPRLKARRIFMPTTLRFHANKRSGVLLRHRE
jgi:hypothetical protein